MVKKRGRRPKYSYALKSSLIRQILLGARTYEELSEAHCIPSSSIRIFVHRYLKNPIKYPEITLQLTPEEEKEFKALKAEKARLEKELLEAQMRADVSEIMIDVAEEMFNISIRKKLGSQQQKPSKKGGKK